MGEGQVEKQEHQQRESGKESKRTKVRAHSLKELGLGLVVEVETQLGGPVSHGVSNLLHRCERNEGSRLAGRFLEEGRSETRNE